MVSAAVAIRSFYLHEHRDDKTAREPPYAGDVYVCVRRAPDVESFRARASHGVLRSHYEAQLALHGDRPVPLIAFWEGVLELTRPSKRHERFESYIGLELVVSVLDRPTAFRAVKASREAASRSTNR